MIRSQGWGKIWCYRVPLYPCILRNLPSRGVCILRRIDVNCDETQNEQGGRVGSLQTLIQRVYSSAHWSNLFRRYHECRHSHLCLYVPPTRNDNMLGTVIAILPTYWGEGNERTIPRSELVIYYYVYNTPIYPFKIFPPPRMIEQKLQLEKCCGGLEIKWIWLL